MVALAALITAMCVSTACGTSQHRPPTSGSVPPSNRTGVPTAATSSAPATCDRQPVTVDWRPDQPLDAALCVHVGTDVVVALHPDARYRWGQPTSSAPGIAAVNEAGMDQDGGTHVTVSTVSAGTAVIESTARIPADPSSPARSWRLTVTVVP
jgi:hypothetical protein